MTFTHIQRKKYILLQITLVLFLWLTSHKNLAYSQQVNSKLSNQKEQIPTKTSDNISAALKLADDIRRFKPVKFQRILKNVSKENNLTNQQQH